MSQISHHTSNPHSQEIEQVLEKLSKITSRSPEEIKPYLDILLNRLSQEEDSVAPDSFYETSSHEEWSAEFHEWVESHKGQDIPVLSDVAMSRENIYQDRL